MKYLDIFWQFFVLGLFSFGGPMAHISYFRKRFVEKLNWLSDESFSKIVALSQFLPGPSSSQVGFTIGLQRGGVLGAVLAFIAFTLPSFLFLYFAALFQNFYNQSSFVEELILGLKLFAVVIVFDATYGMFNSLCKTKISRVIFIFSTMILLIFQNFFMQIVVILLAGIFAIFFEEAKVNVDKKEYKKPFLIPLFIFLVLLILLPFFVKDIRLVELFNSFYQVGSLVFGGGHVVLPLISSNVDINQNSFLTAYSLAQAVPGPMFTIASYIGAVFYGDSPFIGALVATIAIFLPGFLLILSFYKSFESYSKNHNVSKVIMGINASVVAILFTTLCLIVIPNGILNIYDALITIVGVVLLRRYRLPILYLILIFCIYGVLF